MNKAMAIVWPLIGLFIVGLATLERSAGEPFRVTALTAVACMAIGYLAEICVLLEKKK